MSKRALVVLCIFWWWAAMSPVFIWGKDSLTGGLVSLGLQVPFVAVLFWDIFREPKERR